MAGRRSCSDRPIHHVRQGPRTESHPLVASERDGWVCRLFRLVPVGERAATAGQLGPAPERARFLHAAAGGAGRARPPRAVDALIAARAGQVCVDAAVAVLTADARWRRGAASGRTTLLHARADVRRVAGLPRRRVRRPPGHTQVAEPLALRRRRGFDGLEERPRAGHVKKRNHASTGRPDQTKTPSTLTTELHRANTSRTPIRRWRTSLFGSR